MTNWTADTANAVRRKGGWYDPKRVWGRYVGNALVVPPSGFSVPLRAAPPSTIDEEYHLMVDQGGVVHGIVRYRDALGNRYVMGFAFSYTTHKREYDQMVDPDANYHYREDEMPYPSKL